MSQRIMNNVSLDHMTIFKLDNFNDKKTEINMYLSDEIGDSCNIPLYHYYANKDKYTAIHENDKIVPHFKIDLDPSFHLREYQKDIKDSCIDKLYKNHALFLNIFCGYGKTAMGIYISSVMGGRILILNDNQLIQSGWISSYKKFTSIEPVVLTKGIDYSDDLVTPVFIASVDTFCNIPRQFFPPSIHVLFVDEAKCFCTEKRINQLLKCECKFLIGASADIDRNDGMHKSLELFYGPEDSYIKKIWNASMDYVRIFTDLKPEVEYNVIGWGHNAKRALNWNKVLQSCASHVGFNDTIVGLVRLLCNHKILILSKYTHQVNCIYEKLYNYGFDVIRLLGKCKVHIDANVVIGTIKKIGKGYDISTVSKCWDKRNFEVIIMATDMESIEQVFGRGFRVSHPIIIDFIHDLPKLFQHSVIRKNWCIERGATIFDNFIKF